MGDDGKGGVPNLSDLHLRVGLEHKFSKLYMINNKAIMHGSIRCFCLFLFVWEDFLAFIRLFFFSPKSSVLIICYMTTIVLTLYTSQCGHKLDQLVFTRDLSSRSGIIGMFSR